MASNQVVLNLAPGVDSLSVNAAKFDGSVTLVINGKLLGADPAAAGKSSPLAPLVLIGSYVAPVADIDYTALPAKLSVKLNAPDAHADHRPVAGQKLPVRVLVNGVGSRTWRLNAGVMEPNPNLILTVLP